MTTFDEYLIQARRTAKWKPAQEPIQYCTLGLVGEAGEIANKVKKIYRDDEGVLRDEVRDSISGEIGAMLADELGLDMTTIANENLAKLRSRLYWGTIGGSGDNR